MRIYGYYDSPLQPVPVYDPGIVNVCCPICGELLNENNIRTISLMALEDNRSYFYRVHKSCHINLTQEQQANLDGRLIDMIYATKNVN